MDPKSEARQLNIGAHIVVGTPGRLRDHLERGRLRIGELRAVILDEADEMLDLGFREDLEFILEATPAERRTLLFSATLPKEIVTLAKKFQRDAHRIQAGGGERGHADIEYRAIAVAPRDAEHVVVNVLRHVEAPSAIVFCNTRESVRHLQAILSERGFSAVSLSGELSQSERNHALQALRDGRARVCVATDVAARGIDLPNLGLVIHADLPHDPEVLQHRSGRTGRAGRKGVSVLLVPGARRRKAEILLRNARITAEWRAAPSADDIRKLDQERLLQSPILTDESTDDDRAMAAALLAERSAEDIALALTRIYRAQLPAPEDIVDPGTYRENRDKSGKGERGDRGERKGRREPRPIKQGAPLPGGSVWFRLNVGREKNADPRWLLPMICRQGGVTKREIGAIRIFEHETRIEVAGTVSDGFLASVKQVPKGEVRIEPMKPGAELSDPAPGAKPEKDTKPAAPAKKKWEPRERPAIAVEPDFHPDGDMRAKGKPKHKGKFDGKHKPDAAPAKQTAKARPDRGDVRNPSERLSFSDRPRQGGKPAFKGKPKTGGKPAGKKKIGGKPDYSKSRNKGARQG
jgi:ATP-dependent RNA helicase DeaD